MEIFESQFGEVKIWVAYDYGTSIIVKTTDNNLGRAEIEQIMQEYCDKNDLGEVQDAYEYYPNHWTARIFN